MESAGHLEGIAKNIVGAFPFYVLGFLLLAVVNTVVNFGTISLGGINFTSIIIGCE